MFGLTVSVLQCVLSMLSFVFGGSSCTSLTAGQERLPHCVRVPLCGPELHLSSQGILINYITYLLYATTALEEL